jgi:dihydrodipicolinate synthase/N-acetylneuraminate lyase
MRRAAADRARRPRRDLGHANVAPRLMAEMCSAALVGDVRKAREINLRLLPLHPAAVHRDQARRREMGDGADGLIDAGRACRWCR